jgi:uncharacterized protein
LSAHSLKEGSIMTHGTFAWNELWTNDLEGAKSFYGATLGWTFEEMAMPEGLYWVATLGDTAVAGLMEIGGAVPEGTSPHWFSYVEVDDIDERLKDVASNGGTVAREPFDVPGVGRIAILTDATGAMLGLMTSEDNYEDEAEEDEDEDEAEEAEAREKVE